MDPDKTLKMMLDSANQIAKDYEGDGNGIDQGEAAALAESFINLHNWIKRGGFLPKDWQR